MLERSLKVLKMLYKENYCRSYCRFRAKLATDTETGQHCFIMVQNCELVHPARIYNA